jgi:hypothetical protein
MRKLGCAAATAFALLACTGAAVAGGPPAVNETVHSVGATLTDVGLNCATGKPSQRSVIFSGVMRTLMKTDGSYVVRGSFRGNTVFDDLPEADGAPDATARFHLSIGDMKLPSGNAILSEVWSGKTTALGTDVELRFHVNYKVLVDPAGNTKLEFLKFTCD